MRNGDIAVDVHEVEVTIKKMARFKSRYAVLKARNVWISPKTLKKRWVEI
jgi:SOS-response transcriptional repressor LexA